MSITVIDRNNIPTTTTSITFTHKLNLIIIAQHKLHASSERRFKRNNATINFTITSNCSRNYIFNMNFITIVGFNLNNISIKSNHFHFLP